MFSLIEIILLLIVENLSHVILHRNILAAHSLKIQEFWSILFPMIPIKKYAYV